MESVQRWDVKIDAVDHVVELVDAGPAAPWVLMCDGVKHKFPKSAVPGGPSVVSFELDGHPASVTKRSADTTPGAGHQRGSVSVASGVVPTTAFTSYELVVDKWPRGIWTASQVGGELSGSTFQQPVDDVPKQPSPFRDGGYWGIEHAEIHGWKPFTPPSTPKGYDPGTLIVFSLVVGLIVVLAVVATGFGR